ncbi:hypothetical protein A2477_03860 [Candidatus Falkowbacteria bacterium RIFOXYC2_FULL_47_12]|uniref:Methyltransferase type 12 n=2 Tax=Candidatus Falkowiibacteriota TaxID=1752728 RepID=A0A1F5TQ12_9BACT|nr:MAG: hypothetical protein A2242_04465 [Candidatus Falkowbacteria bacterium RIFOXYA2_FULL_47_9]OGF40611.1 MAG: hypothetical protein A2477_03860 [Candidatus Falkowbacteria bacterium RIFOXYC2_FULL_47_12]
MKQWSRIIPFKSQNSRMETWIYDDSDIKKRYEVDVTLGKPIDITALKLNELENFHAQVVATRDSRTNLFQSVNMREVTLCPICQRKTDKNIPPIFEVYTAHYVQCPSCLHCYVATVPSDESLHRFYASNKEYQKIYTDKRTADIRVQQVALPKAEWAIHQYYKLYGKKPHSVLDVGAGSGHFVQACRSLGLKADGVEISESGREFCKTYFGFELANCDFTREWQRFKDYDMVTFWAVIEHVSNPMAMLAAGSKIVFGKEGLVVADVPRWDSFSTAVQNQFSNSVIRHLDPLGHINCFTDSSLATAYVLNNLDIVSAWYFGMDAYELVTQLSHALPDGKIIETLKSSIPAFQKSIDLAILSDEMVFAGKPSSL